jgi:hypothetical protein
MPDIFSKTRFVSQTVPSVDLPLSGRIARNSSLWWKELYGGVFSVLGES